MILITSAYVDVLELSPVIEQRSFCAFREEHCG